MCEFKIGDKVVCACDGRYIITTSEADLTVVGGRGDEICVRVDAHRSPRHLHRVGNTYWVYPEYFKLAKPKFKGDN